MGYQKWIPFQNMWCALLSLILLMASVIAFENGSMQQENDGTELRSAARWYTSNVKEDCTSVCKRHLLKCDDQTMSDYNAQVDTPFKVSSVLQINGIGPDKIPLSHIHWGGSRPDVPSFSITNRKAFYSERNRSPTTVSCAAIATPPVENMRRLCYCSELTESDIQQDYGYKLANGTWNTPSQCPTVNNPVTTKLTECLQLCTNAFQDCNAVNWYQDGATSSGLCTLLKCSKTGQPPEIIAPQNPAPRIPKSDYLNEVRHEVNNF